MKDWCSLLLIAGLLLLLLSLFFFYLSQGDLHVGKIIGGFFLILSVMCFISFGGLKYKQWVADSHKKGRIISHYHAPGCFIGRVFFAPWLC